MPTARAAGALGPGRRRRLRRQPQLPLGFPDVPEPSRPGGALLIAGSIATDHLMNFGGKFEDSLVVEQLHKLSVSFLVDDLEIRRGGVAANMCFGLGRLRAGPLLLGWAGGGLARHRSRLPRA